jgi:exodeoxyribonuclease-3
MGYTTPMIVSTFNCNSVRQRLGIVLDWLAVRRPDVLALQETKVVDEQFPARDFEAAGWHVVFRGEKSYNGVAMITRAAPAAVSFGLGDGDGGESETRLVDVRVGGVRVVNTYVPQGQDFDSPKYAMKQRWLERLHAYLAARVAPGEDLVWVGDLNIAPEPSDVYDHEKLWPHVAHCAEMTAAYRRFLDLGLVDVFRQHLPGPDVYTFWDYRFRGFVEKNKGWRIDHVIASPTMAARSREVDVDVAARRLDKPSDHTFVTARFD